MRESQHRSVVEKRSAMSGTCQRFPKIQRLEPMLESPGLDSLVEGVEMGQLGWILEGGEGESEVR